MLSIFSNGCFIIIFVQQRMLVMMKVEEAAQADGA